MLLLQAGTEPNYLGHSLNDLLWFVGILSAGLLFRRIVSGFVSRNAYLFVKKASQNHFAEEFVNMARKPVEQLFLLIIFYFAFSRLSFPPEWGLAEASTYGLRWAILVVYKIAVLVVGVKLLLRAADFGALVISKKQEEVLSPELIFFLKELIKVALVILSIFAGLRFIFNVNITALIASLGIGGLAVALAAQDTLANLLGSFIIYLDSPFKPGDTIEFGETSGVVEHVGFRTTRIRTFNKSLLIVPNKKIADSILNNISSSEKRRVKFELNLTYSATESQIRKIIEEIGYTIQNHPQTSSDQLVRFKGFGSSSLDILVLYFVEGNEYENMTRVNEEINFSIMEIVKRNGCAFAYPTQSIYLTREQS